MKVRHRVVPSDVSVLISRTQGLTLVLAEEQLLALCRVLVENSKVVILVSFIS